MKKLKENLNSLCEKLKNNKRERISFIVLVLAILVIITTLLVWALSPKEESTKVLKKEYETAINDYAKKIEAAVLVYKTENNGKIPTWDNLPIADIDSQGVVCATTMIVYDGSVYLKDCYMSNSQYRSDYAYGENKEEVIESPKGKLTISVYNEYGTVSYAFFPIVENENVKVTNTYTVDCATADCAGLAVNRGYAVINDNNRSYVYDYINEIKYPLNVTIDSAYETTKTNDDKTTKIVGFGIKNAAYKYGFFSIEKKTITIPFEYDNIDSYFGYPGYETKEPVIIAKKGELYGLINYLTNTVVINFENEIMDCYGDYCITGKEGATTLHSTKGIALLNGKSYEKIYTSSEAGYSIVLEKDNNVNVVNEKAEFVTTLTNIKQYSSFSDSGYADFEGQKYIYSKFYTDSTSADCVEFSYNIDTKKVTSKKETCGGYGKPVLYLYPTTKTNVTVSFERPEMLTTTYPKFTNNWDVTANTDGDLYDKNGKYYYALYWEEMKNHTIDFNEGFYVTKDNAIKFLEDKLTTIGLNAKEQNEFIMYWLPVLEKNEKNLVYFELTTERDSYNKLIISPKPDSMLRVAIHVKKVDKVVNIKEQALPTFNRTGFSVVEWGGINY